MKLLIQPDDGFAPILSAIKGAKKSIEIVIFRLDRQDMEAALKTAVGRGVHVHALIANTNRNGEQHLRQLEMRFLDAGVTVARTSGDLIRYHDKVLLIDRSTLYVLSFNYTTLDMDQSRGFGIVTKNRKFVKEAINLFEADTKRRPYAPECNDFIVSPINARKQLSLFIKKAKKELLIYDPKIADSQMIHLLLDRLKAGVHIKIIGALGKSATGLSAQELSKMRLHTRTIIRDQRHAFVGSQSLRKMELDSRREVGLIIHDVGVVRELVATFESDWAAKVSGQAEETAQMDKNPEKTEKIIVKELSPLTTTVKQAVKKVVEKAGAEAFADKKVQATIKKVIKKAVKETMKEAIEKTTENTGGN